jgi:hypothetical protein
MLGLNCTQQAFHRVLVDYQKKTKKKSNHTSVIRFWAVNTLLQKEWKVVKKMNNVRFVAL